MMIPEKYEGSCFECSLLKFRNGNYSCTAFRSDLIAGYIPAVMDFYEAGEERCSQFFNPHSMMHLYDFM